jgi:DNA-binding MarR family transcriptional regulator
MNKQEREDALTLDLLDAIDEHERVSQRHLADRMGVALGLANLYLKRCVRRGWIKIKQAPANRYAYYLTPKGFAEKSRLTARYLSVSFDFYRRATESFDRLFLLCGERNWRRIMLCGVSELSEIASLRAQEHDVEIVGTYDPMAEQSLFLRRPVWRAPEDCASADACLLLSAQQTAQRHAELQTLFDPDAILIPGLLRFRPNGRNQAAPAPGRKW